MFKRNYHLYNLLMSLFILAGSCLYRKRDFFVAKPCTALPFLSRTTAWTTMERNILNLQRLKNKLKAYLITNITMTFFKTGLSCP